MTDSGTSTIIKTQPPQKRHGFFMDVLIRLVQQKPLGTFGLIVVIILLLTGIFAPLLAPFGINEIHLADRLMPPGGNYLLGTDQLGRDVLSNIIYGARVSVIIGLSASAIQTVLSTAIGAMSGLIGGKFDLIFQRFVDAWMSIPPLLILLTLVAIVGKGMLQIILVIAIPGAIAQSRIPRSAVISIKENVYVEAAKAIGSTTPRLLFRHILPNIVPLIIIMFTTYVGGVILLEAALSFLGFGVPPGVPSWGSMLSMEGRQYMEMAPALALWPGAALSITVYGINMFGDAMRDLLDPKLRGKVGRYGATGKKKPGLG
jgi:peptide/nickel transport system permease protein